MLAWVNEGGRGELWSQWAWDVITCLMSCGEMPAESVSSSILVFDGVGLKCLCRFWISGG